jgi:hypothetical protein
MTSATTISIGNRAIRAALTQRWIPARIGMIPEQ